MAQPMTRYQREQVCQLMADLFEVRPAAVVAILRPCKRRGWNTMAQISDSALWGIWGQWGHLAK